MHKGVTWILTDQVCNWAGHLILAQCCWGLCCGRVLPGVETLSQWKGSVGSGCGEVIVGLTMEKDCETFCWDIWDLRVFHANFKLQDISQGLFIDWLVLQRPRGTTSVEQAWEFHPGRLARNPSLSFFYTQTYSSLNRLDLAQTECSFLTQIDHTDAEGTTQ